jgi:hypothetical protein
LVISPKGLEINETVRVSLADAGATPKRDFVHGAGETGLRAGMTVPSRGARTTMAALAVLRRACVDTWPYLPDGGVITKSVK